MLRRNLNKFAVYFVAVFYASDIPVVNHLGRKYAGYGQFEVSGHLISSFSYLLSNLTVQIKM